jgi:hypothetical protein
MPTESDRNGLSIRLILFSLLCQKKGDRVMVRATMSSHLYLTRCIRTCGLAVVILISHAAQRLGTNILMVGLVVKMTRCPCQIKILVGDKQIRNFVCCVVCRPVSIREVHIGRLFSDKYIER